MPYGFWVTLFCLYLYHMHGRVTNAAIPITARHRKTRTFGGVPYILSAGLRISFIR